MLSMTCRCILYALVSVVVLVGCRSRTGEYEAEREKSQCTLYKKLHSTTAAYAIGIAEP